MLKNTTGTKFLCGDKVMINRKSGSVGPVLIDSVDNIHNYPLYYGIELSNGMRWIMAENDLTLYVDNQTPASVEVGRKIIHGESPAEMPNPETKITSEECTHHQWVTTTMFQFDTTYCKKCGVKRDA